MSYIDRTLASGEHVVRRGKWPLAYWVGAYLWLIFLGVFIIGIIFYLMMVIRMSTTEFAVTNHRIVLKTGWLRRRTQELAIDSVEGVSLRQSLVGRILGYGQVLATGTGDAIIEFPPMAKPLEFRRAMEVGRTHGRELRLSDEDVEKLAAAQYAPEPRRRVRALGALGRR